MKKCKCCTNPATLHITEIKLGEAQALHLCESCAQKYLSQVEVGGDPNEFGEGLDGEEESLEQAEAELDEGQACPQCGITFKQFRSIGRLGCPECYNAFREELLPLLDNIHSETQHVGKCVPRSSERSKRQIELSRLRQALKSAVDSENYEEAARLRDEIQTVERRPIT